MKKNDVFTVTIEDMGEDGAGIGKTDGYTWFIKDALMPHPFRPWNHKDAPELPSYH